MNNLTIIGRLTKDPEARTTPSGATVCSFTVAVNRRKTQSNQQPEADYFRVSAWNKLAENCEKYLAKGRKVSVLGSVSVSTYQSQDGKTYASMNVMANEIEFLSSRSEGGTKEEAPATDEKSGMMVVESDDLPF